MSINRRMDKKDVHYICGNITQLLKKKLSFVTTLMDLEIIILNEVSQRKTNII